VSSDVQAGVIVDPIIATGPRGYPELSGGPVGRRIEGRGAEATYVGGFSPAVPTGKRFDRDFSRDW
jgi:hypothetical protein